MALLTQTLVKFTLRVVFAAPDANGAIVERSKNYEVEAHGADDAAKWDNAIIDVDAFLDDLANMTDADIVAHSVSGVYDTSSALTGTAVNLYKELLLTLIPDGVGKNDIPHSIPAPATAILANGTAVNPTANVLAYLDNFQSDAYMRVSDGEKITSGATQIRASRVKTVSSGKRYS